MILCPNADRVVSEPTEGPEMKRRKEEERDLSFLLVKNRDAQNSLFVDLGKFYLSF